MSNTHHISSSKSGLTATAYRGDGSVLLGFDLDEHLTKDFAGFAVRMTAPDSPPAYLKNRLSFDKPLAHDSTPEQRQAAWTDSDKAPFQKFRWQHFPKEIVKGQYTYEVIAMYFAKGKTGRLVQGPAVDVSLALVPSDYGHLQVGFTRSYVSSQAYATEFGNKPIRKLPKTLDYDTAEFQAQYKFLGFTARTLVFDFLNECLNDPGVTVDVFAYDLDEPDIVRSLEKLGNRLRIFMDDAPLHTKHGALEVEAKRRLIQSGGADHVHTGHFSRFAHDKVMIQRKGGQATKVLTGSANFSVRGLYVQANNVLVFDDEVTAGLYAAVFDQVWKNATTKAFATSKLSQKWWDELARPGLPPFEVCFSPHKTANVSLSVVSDAIDAAKSSVLFSVMELGGGGAVLKTLKDLASNRDIFSYGVTQSVAESKVKGKEEETTRGVTFHQPGAKKGVLVPFAYLKQNVPPPFDKEVDGGAGQVIHNKFVVVDFNDAKPAVFTGSSNLADGGEKSNGDNLIAIYDRALATLYGVEAIRLVDHYSFRAALKNAKSEPLMLRSNQQGWWKPYYDEKDIKYTERLLFVK